MALLCASCGAHTGGAALCHSCGAAARPAASLPSLRALLFELGLAYLRRGSYPDAIAAHERACAEPGATPPRWLLCINLALTHSAAGDAGRALAVGLEALEEAPEQCGLLLGYLHRLLTPAALAGLGEELQTLGDRLLSRGELSLSLRLELLIFLGRADLMLAAYTRADERFGAAYQIDPLDARVLEGLGEARWLQRDLPRALELFGEAYKLAGAGRYPERQRPINVKLVRALLDAGQYQRAAVRADAALLAEADGFYAVEMRTLRAHARLALGQHQSALADAERARASGVELSGAEQADLHQLRARALLALKRYPDAVAAADLAIGLAPGNPDTLFLKIRALLEGQISLVQARQLLESFARRSGSQELAGRADALVQAADGDALYAAAEILAFLAREQGLPLAERALAAVDAALAAGLSGGSVRYAIAAAHQIRARLLDPDAPVHVASANPATAGREYYEAGRRYGWRDEFSLAAELLERAAALRRYHAPSYYHYADALRRLSNGSGQSERGVREIVERACQTIRAGLAAGLPDTEHFWAYNVAALSNERLGELTADADTRAHLWWEALGFIEAGLLVNADKALSWAFLGRYMRLLQLWANCGEVTARALKRAPEELLVIEERVLYLANAGYFNDELFAHLDELASRDASYTDWARGVQAYVHVHSGRPEPGLALVNEAMGRLAEAQTPIVPFLFETAGYAYRALNQPICALRIYRRLLREVPDQPDYASARAAALYRIAMLGDPRKRAARLEQAAEQFRSMLNDPYDGYSAACYLGLCLQALDRPEAAEQFAEGVRRTERPGYLEIMRAFEHPQLEALGVMPLVEERIAALARPRSPVDELEGALAAAADDPRLAQLIDRAATAGLARLARTQERWLEAIDLYERLAAAPDFAYAAALGIGAAVAGLRAQGEAALRSWEIADAKAAFVRALDACERQPVGDLKTRAELHALLAAAAALVGDAAAVESHERQALLLLPADGDAPGRLLAETVGAVLQPDELWEIYNRWRASSAESPALASAAQTLFERLVAVFQLDASTPEAEVLSQIVLEIDKGLVPADTSADGPMLKSYVPDVRTHMQQQMGVQLPGIRVREVLDQAPGDFIVKIDETAVAFGHAHLEKILAFAPPQRLVALGIPASASAIEHHPVSAAPGAWVDERHLPLVEQAGLEWIDPLRFAIASLEAVLYRHLHDITRYQSVQWLLRSWAEREGWAERIARAAPTTDARRRMTMLVRALLQERVSVAPWPAIIDAVEQVGLDSDEIGPVLGAARLRLRPYLPGNTPGAHRLVIPEELDALLAGGVRHDGYRQFLALAPETAGSIFRRLAELIGGEVRELVLVTRRPELRLLWRRLIASQFPDLMVLAADELISTGALISPAVESVTHG